MVYIRQEDFMMLMPVGAPDSACVNCVLPRTKDSTVTPQFHVLFTAGAEFTLPAVLYYALTFSGPEYLLRAVVPTGPSPKVSVLCRPMQVWQAAQRLM